MPRDNEFLRLAACKLHRATCRMPPCRPDLENAYSVNGNRLMLVPCQFDEVAVPEVWEVPANAVYYDTAERMVKAAERVLSPWLASWSTRRLDPDVLRQLAEKNVLATLTELDDAKDKLRKQK